MNPDNHLVQNISTTMLKYIFYGSPSVHQLSFVFINDNLILKCQWIANIYGTKTQEIKIAKQWKFQDCFESTRVAFGKS